MREPVDVLADVIGNAETWIITGEDEITARLARLHLTRLEAEFENYDDEDRLSPAAWMICEAILRGCEFPDNRELWREATRALIKAARADLHREVREAAA